MLEMRFSAIRTYGPAYAGVSNNTRRAGSPRACYSNVARLSPHWTVMTWPCVRNLWSQQSAETAIAAKQRCSLCAEMRWSLCQPQRPHDRPLIPERSHDT